MPRGERGDRAEGAVLGEILLVVLTLVGGALLFFLFSGSDTQEAPPPAIGMTSASSIDSGNKTYTVASGTAGMRWNEMRFFVEGVEFTYDGNLSAVNTFCVTSGSSCMSTSAWNSGRGVVEPGSEITFRGSSLAGRSLTVTDSTQTTTIASVPFGT